MTKQITKPAAAKTTAKVETKPVTRTRTPSKVTAAVKALFILTDLARPQRGPRLFAHTMAALTVLGMVRKNRPLVPTSALQSFVGSSAIAYHTKTKGTLVEVGEKIQLTEFGLGYFPSRSMKLAEVEGFQSVMTTGQPNEACGIRKEQIVAAGFTL